MYWYNIIGLIGVILIVGAYFLLHLEKLSSNDIIYSLANLIGALLILISLYFEFNLSALIVEIFWFCISAYGLFKKLKT